VRAAYRERIAVDVAKKLKMIPDKKEVAA